MNAGGVMLRSLLIVILLLTSINIAQPRKTQRDHMFSRTMVITIEGGFTRGFTDYDDPVLDLNARAMLEYFLPATSSSVFGIRGFAGTGYLKGKDYNITPNRFKTDLIYGGGGLVYSLSINDVVFPYLFAGASYLYYNPKGPDNEPLPNNLAGVFSQNTINYNGELGLRVLLARDLSFNLSTTAFIGTEDYLDDVLAGNENDFFFTVNAGLSFSFFGRTDSDGDGIYDSDDQCPDEPEDFDNFQDNDGCPDIDDDEDGIVDRLDKCKHQKEDFDGFEDEDGCPDVDNDKDGILDADDKCPNQVEDFDGYQDSDGCPDNDNDGDGILDKNDGCPGEPETRNGYEDEDGCPDEKPVQAPKEMILRSGTTFAVGKSELNPAAFQELDKIVAVIKDNPDSRWRIEGHTDNTGSSESNKKLSYNRALAVLEYFTSQGLARNRFEVFGLGEDIPVADNSTEEGRALNRRVVILRID